MPDLSQLYQDPYERQMLQQYHGDPRERRETPSLGSSALQLAKNMAIFVAVSAGLRGFGKLASRAGAGILREVGKKSIGGNNLDGIFRANTKGIRALFDKLGSNYTSEVSVYKKWSQNWAEKAKELKSMKKGPAFDGMKNLDLIVNRRTKFYRSKIADFWKPENLFQRLTGKGFSATTSLLGISAQFYAVDKVINVFGSQKGREREHTPWYNLPAHVRNYARFTAQTLPSLIVFRNLGIGVGLGSEVAKDVLARGSKAAGLWGVGPLLGKLAAKVPNVRGAMKGAGTFYRGLQSYPVHHFLYPGKRPIRYAWTKARQSAKQYVDNSRISPSSQLEYTISQVERNNALRNRDKRGILFNWIRQYRSKPVPSSVERFLGLRRQSLRTKDIDNILSGIGRDKDTVDMWKKMLVRFKEKGVPVYDKGVYKAGEGTGELVDLRNIHPKRVFENFVNLWNKHTMMPLFKIRALSLFPIQPMINYKPMVKYVNRGEAHVIGIPRGMDGIDKLDRWSPKDPDGGLFANGKFYTHMKGSDGIGRLMQVTSPRSDYMLMSTGRNSSFNTVMNNFVGNDTLVRQKMQSEIRSLGPLGKLLHGTLDIKRFAGPGSVIGWFKNAFTRMLRDKSPDHVLKTMDQSVNVQDDAMWGSYISTLRSTLRRTGSYGSNVLRKNMRVLERVSGVDPSMSDVQLRDTVEGVMKNIRVDGTFPARTGGRLLSQFKVTELLKRVDGDNEFRAFDDIIRRASNRDAITGRESLFEFLGAANILRRGKVAGAADYLDDVLKPLTESGTINKTQAAGMRVWLQKFQVEDLMPNPGEPFTGDTMSSIRELIRPYRKDHETIIRKVFKPLTSFFTAEDYSEMGDFATTEGFSGFTAIPMGKTVAKFDVAREDLFDNIYRKATRVIGGEKGGSVFGGRGAHFGGISGSVWGAVVARRLERLFDYMGFGLDVAKYKTGSSLLFNGILARRALPIAAGMYAYDFMDKTTDINPMFDGSIFDEGLGVAAADMAVKARMMLAHSSDFLGITDAAKYAEGLMPGFLESPLMRAMRGAVAPVLGGAKIGQMMTGSAYGSGLGLLAGVGLGAMQGFGAFDITKSTEELEDIYSGREEVPIRRGRWWLLSSSNFQGGRIQYFRPNWYARMKSKYKDTPDGLGSPIEQLLYKPLPLVGFNPLSNAFDPHHYAYRHYYSQPYPMTGTAFEEFPIVGPTLASTVGRLIKPPQMMHNQELQSSLGLGSYNPAVRNTPGGGKAGGVSPFEPGTSQLRTRMDNLVSDSDFTQSFDRQMYNITEAAGLWGFGSETMMEKLLGFRQPFEGQKIMGSASQITSLRRSYWDLNLGDPFGATELWRRFVPRPRQHLNIFNPLVNKMPSWMPDKFHIGNPYAQLPEGELLLPGTGYESAHDVNMTLPVHAEMLGLPVEDTVRAMMGIYPKNRSKYHHNSTDLDRINRETLIGGLVYDQFHNVSGMHDGIIRAGRIEGIKKMKKLSDEELDAFVGPPNADISEMNWYLKQMGLPFGVLQYQNQGGEPVMTYPVKYSQRRSERDMEIINKARYVARDLIDKGMGFGSEAYSHIDRMNILANVAPYSNEYKAEEQIVNLQIKGGMPLKDKFNAIKRKKKALMMKQEFYPYRFAGKVFTPDAKYNNMSLNEDIQAATEYTLPERFIGSIWEGFSHMNTPFHSKFMHYRTPRESYERSTLYGRDIKIWGHPVDHFASAYARGFMSKRTSFAGGIAGAMAGYVVGGPGLGTAAGAGIGAIYGGVHGVYRSLTGTTYIPGVIKEQRKMGRYFDQMSYTKNMMLYDMSGDDQFLEEARGTMMGLIPGDSSRQSWSYMYRATPPQERPFIMSFIREGNPTERARILELVPDEVGEILRSKWATADRIYHNANLSRHVTEPMPNPDWAGWAPEIPLEDVKVKLIERRGMDAHDFGLGWYDQVNRMNQSPLLDRTIVDMKDTTAKNQLHYNQNISEMRRTIEVSLQSMGIRGNITITPGIQNRVTIINT